MQFSELTSEITQILFASHNLIDLRLICKDFKARIENFPEFTIHLSPGGTQNASSEFFVQFKGKITVGSRYGWDHQKGWFRSLVDAILRGLQVHSILPLTLNTLSLPPFSSMLHDACCTKIQNLYITFRGTLRNLSNSIAALSAMCIFAEKIELTLEILYRRPRVVLKDVVDRIKVLGDAIDLKGLLIRSVRP
jgi:hypothetical protein